jgi:hypothetical protein
MHRMQPAPPQTDEVADLPVPQRRTMAIPFVVLATTQLLALLQFTSLASPLLPEQTVFDQGADAFLGVR